MKLKYVWIILAVLTFTSCSTKMSAVKDLRHLNYELATYGDQYNLEDWKAAAADFQEINQRIRRYDYTAEQREEIGRLKGECIANFGKGVVSNTITKITNAASELKGLIEGLKSVLGKDE